MKRALITGIGGQDGSYLAEHLLRQGYRVSGTIRAHPESLVNLTAVRSSIQFFYADMRDSLALETAIRKSQPDEIYNLAAQPFVPPSWTHPAETMDVNAGGLARLLDAARKACPQARVYQASTSEMFGEQNGSIREDSPMHPNSPYGAAKVAAHQLVQIYRRTGMYVVSGILCNHESPRRGTEMVTKKMAMAVADWYVNGPSTLEMGNLEAKRDWGFAGDYVRAMHLMLQQPEPQDYVIGTGTTHSIADFFDAACGYVGLAAGLITDWREYIVTKPEFLRKNDTAVIVGDSSKARVLLGWEPEISFQNLVAAMVEHEVHELQRKQKFAVAGR